MDGNSTTRSTRNYNGKTPGELITSGRAKFALSQARLRQRQVELALLSLLGSLEDVLRAHLLLNRHPATSGDWFALLQALCVDTVQPLSRDEVARLYRMHRLRLRIVQGETVTLTYETFVLHQQFVADLLARYGVLVAAPETLPASLLALRAPGGREGVQSFWMRYRNQLVPGLMILFIFVIGATATVFLQQVRSNQASVIARSVPSVVPTIATAGPDQPTVLPPTATTLPPYALAPGRTAYVRPDITSGLALRASPSSNPDVPVQIYLSGDTAVRVLEGPIEADGYTWWQVRAANQEGWCAGEFLEVR